MATAEILGYRPSVPVDQRNPPPAQEPPPPEEIASSDELYLPGCTWSSIATPPARRRPTGARRCGATPSMPARTTRWALAPPPRRVPAWPRPFPPRHPAAHRPQCQPLRRRALLQPGPLSPPPDRRRDDGPTRLTPAGPPDDRFADAYAAFYKATWSQAWSGAGYHALAEMDCRRGRWATALEHLDRAWAAIAITSASATCAASCSASWAARPRPTVLGRHPRNGPVGLVGTPACRRAHDLRPPSAAGPGP